MLNLMGNLISSGKSLHSLAKKKKTGYVSEFSLIYNNAKMDLE